MRRRKRNTAYKW